MAVVRIDSRTLAVSSSSSRDLRKHPTRGCAERLTRMLATILLLEVFGSWRNALMTSQLAPLPFPLDDRPIARVWHGIVPVEKADGYAAYLTDSDLGVSAYQAIAGNRGVALLKRIEGKQVHFLLVSFWDSEEAIREYTGPDIERARYFRYDLECLVDPEQKVAHYEVLNRVDDSATPRPQPSRDLLIERALRLSVPTGLW
jgi:heme-degrading monooxygenase HmoA